MPQGLNDIQYDAHSIEIKDASGNGLVIDGSGFLTTNINGVVSVDDNGGSLTVDGTVAATQSGTWTIDSITNDVNIADGGNSITVDDGGASLTVDGTVDIGNTVETVPGGFASWKVSAASVTTSESELVATPLTGRLRLLIQNLSSKEVYLKEATGVSTANGMLLPKKGFYEADLDDGADIFAIAASGTADVRIVEYAA